MATIFMDGAETGSTGWMYSPTGASMDTSVVAGTWRTYSIRQAGNTTSGALWNTSANTFYGQARIYFNGGSLYERAIEFLSPNGVENCRISWAPGGQIEAQLGDNQAGPVGGIVLGTGTTVFAYNRWYYLQWKITIADATGTGGTFVIKVDGNTEVNIVASDNKDTRYDAGTNGNLCDRLTFFNTSTSTGVWWSDVIINDETGTDNVTYPDNLGIEALMPNAIGDNTSLIRGGTDSGSNYGQVDERPPNDGTDYVYDTVVDDYDIYNLPATQWTSVSAVAVALRCQKSDAGAANIAHMLKIDTNADGTADELDTGPDVPLSTSWTYHTNYYNRQPDNSGATSWTAAKVNALQAGAKVR